MIHGLLVSLSVVPVTGPAKAMPSEAGGGDCDCLQNSSHAVRKLA